MLTETLHSATIESLKNDQLRANGALNRNPSKIRRLSALLNKKFNRNRLSREKISPPVLVTASSFIEAVPIAKPAKELACVEKSTTTSQALNPSHGAGLSGQLSRQSSKSSTHTLQRQLSEREILRLSSHKVTKHNGFLSGSSLSSFTSDGSSDKHSSYGTYNREGLSASYAPVAGNDWTVSNSEVLDSYSPFPILSESFNQQTTEWERVALAKQFKADCISNTDIISSTISESEETPLAECEIPNSDVVSLTEVSSPLHRFSHPNITTSPKWTDIETKERVKSDDGT
ncbi:hypothetical protein K7432_012663 [Basidiobolus ranarum]|uniref:Uncharacterized protein n=1 Tax=Basidiobolus ranarum TaxID=34480 RepID=A0ABR2WKK4_9FUNG